ncbi:hypothetical protein PEM37_00910 [Streptomyces sp. AD681]|nr:hypothetical protein [Streptomyces sp. AD681]MDA5140042.1 hypothetical protein [Streptomyces sp. AD681]
MTDPGLPAFPQLGAGERPALTNLARQQSAVRLRVRIVPACAE